MSSKSYGWMLVVILLLLLGWGDNLADVFAQRPAGGADSQPAVSSGSMVSHSLELPDGRQQITLIDSRVGSMAVYQVDPRNGAIALKSVRSIQWDMRMDEFNGGTPSPKEIRSLLEQR